MVDLKKDLGLGQSTEEAFQLEALRIATLVQKHVEAHPHAIERMALMRGVVQLILVDLIKNWPRCPCELMGTLLQWMGQVASAERYHQPVVVALYHSQHTHREEEGS